MADTQPAVEATAQNPTEVPVADAPVEANTTAEKPTESKTEESTAEKSEEKEGRSGGRKFERNDRRNGGKFNQNKRFKCAHLHLTREFLFTFSGATMSSRTSLSLPTPTRSAPR